MSTPEQQLAEVIHRGARWGCSDGCPFPDCCYASGYEESQAAAIVAAVNSGRIDPIVPDGHTTVAPGETAIPDCDDVWELLTGFIESKDHAVVDAAELASLRALKAKVDSLEPFDPYAVRVPGWPRPARLCQIPARLAAGGERMSGEDDEVTAAERDVIEAAREHVARYSPAALNDSFRTLLAAVDRLAAARDKETT